MDNGRAKTERGTPAPCGDTMTTDVKIYRVQDFAVIFSVDIFSFILHHITSKHFAAI